MRSKHMPAGPGPRAGPSESTPFPPAPGEDGAEGRPVAPGSNAPIVLDAPGPGETIETDKSVVRLDGPDDGAPDSAAAGEASAKEAALVWRRYRFVSLGLMLSDSLCAVGALLLSRLIVMGGTDLPVLVIAALVATPVLWIGVFHAFGLYAPRHLSAPEEFRRVIAATSIGIVGLILGSFWVGQRVPRAWIGVMWFLALCLQLASRRIWRWYLATLKRDERLGLRTLIVGTNDEAGRLADTLATGNSGHRPVGFVGLSPSSASPNGLAVVGSLGWLSDLIREHSAHCVFVASSAIGSDLVFRVAQVARREGAEVTISANLPQMLASRVAVQPIGNAMALALKPVRLTGGQWAVKRAFDLVVSLIALLFALPIMGVIALAIRVTSPGPALFSQERVTKGGRVFRMHKFRTMVPDADKILDHGVVDITAPFFKLEDDPRLTSVGAFLRKFSLDELPQLFNVIKGDMSLVGPRPLPAEQVSANREFLAPRHEVPAGISGWWQVSGRSDVAPEEALGLDLFYIENWSLSLDLYILIKTVGVLISRRGAY